MPGRGSLTKEKLRPFLLNDKAHYEQEEKKMTTRNLYEVAYYRTKGIEPVKREIRDRTVYFHFSDTDELKKARTAFLELDPVFFEVAKMRSKLIDELKDLRGGRHE